MTCRSIPQDKWEHARSVLVFYFARRTSAQKAEDLAQETLTTLWGRTDYEFDKEEDFLKVCYGFAAFTLCEAYRKDKRHAGTSLEERETFSGRGSRQLFPAEMRTYLQEVLAIAKSCLKEKDWLLLQASLEMSRDEMASQFSVSNSNNVGVMMHRARKKLEKKIGWKQTLL